jgi:hypothetical protein
VTDFYLGERIMQLTVAEEHRQAELRRLQKEIRAGRTSWLARQRCRGLSWLGSTLVSSGLQLLQSISPLHPDVEGNANRKS